MKVLAAALLAASMLAPLAWASAPLPDVFLLGPEPQHFPVPASAEGLGPGTKLLLEKEDGTYLCTANFVWTGGGKTYLGTAGHCLVPEAERVLACVASCSFGGQAGAIFTGSLVTLGRTAFARSGGVGEDFGLLEIPGSLASEIRPGMPVWGGPTTTEEPGGLFVGRPALCTYGAGVGTGEFWPTMARTGPAMSKDANEGTYTGAYPSNGGDSGSAVVVCEPEGTSGLHGTRPVGVHTHSLASTLKYGTTLVKAKQLASAAGLTIEIVLPS